MPKNTIALCLMILLCGFTGSCSLFSALTQKPTETDDKNISLWVSQPQSNSLIIYGVSGRQSKPEMEFENARADAARKMAIYSGVRAVSQNYQNIGSSLLDHFIDTDVSLEYDQNFEKYSDKLVFNPENDVVIIDGATFVRFSYPAAFPGRTDYSFTADKSGRPGWISQPPLMIGDSFAAVGFGKRQQALKDTILKSYESAIASMVSRISTSVFSDEISRAGSGASGSMYSKSEGKLVNFLALEIWIEPVTLNVYTLALARQAP